jgi:hypothetical protein
MQEEQPVATTKHVLCHYRTPIDTSLAPAATHLMSSKRRNMLRLLRYSPGSSTLWGSSLSYSSCQGAGSKAMLSVKPAGWTGHSSRGL